MLYDNMVTMYDSIIDVRARVDSVQGIVETVQSNLPPPPAPASDNPSLVSYHGCDGADNDGDGFIDECDEDDSPPEIILPGSFMENGGCDNPTLGSDTRPRFCLDQYFKTTDEAESFLRRSLKVSDDCAQSAALRLDITPAAVPMCEKTEFVATPVHTCDTYESCGEEVVFEIGVDSTVPAVTCGFNSEMATEMSQTNVLFVDSDFEGNFVDTSFFFDLEENCGDEVKVDITVKANEISKDKDEMFFLSSVEDLNGVTQAFLCVSNQFCDDTLDPIPVSPKKEKKLKKKRTGKEGTAKATKNRKAPILPCRSKPTSEHTFLRDPSGRHGCRGQQGLGHLRRDCQARRGQ